MAEETTPHGDEDQTPQGNTAEEPTAGTQSEIDWKAEARKHEKRAKENFERAKANELAAKRLAEIEEAQKTEAEKTADRIAALEAENQSYKTREQQAAWRAEVAESTGIPADALRGSTVEEIQAHAETLKPLLTPAEPAPSKDGPVLTVGQSPATPGAVPLRDQIAAAEKAGDRETVAALKALQLGSPS